MGMTCPTIGPGAPLNSIASEHEDFGANCMYEHHSGNCLIYHDDDAGRAMNLEMYAANPFVSMARESIIYHIPSPTSAPRVVSGDPMLRFRAAGISRGIASKLT